MSVICVSRPRRGVGRAILLAAGFSGLLTACPAVACTLRLGSVHTTPIAYDPFLPSTIDARVGVDVELVDGNSCDGLVELQDQNGARLRQLRLGGATGPLFRVEPVAGKGGIPSADAAVLAVHLTTAQPRQRVEWRLIPVSDSVLAPGSYVQPIQIAASGEGFAGTGPALGALTLESVPRAQVTLAGAATRFAAGSDTLTLDLGELSTGVTGRAYLQMRANTPARLMLVSRNRGYLQNEAVPTARVTYSLSLDGIRVDLGSPATIPVAAVPTLDGLSIPIIATVGTVTGAAAGRYSDTVTIDISP